MTTIQIRTLQAFDRERFCALVSGYVTDKMYRVSHRESDRRTDFSLELTDLDGPQVFRFPFSDDDFRRYEVMAANGFCVAAYLERQMIGIGLAEPQEWNRTLWVWDFHVAEDYRGQGVGRSLMAWLAARAQAAGLRAVVCETQNTNVAAIRFYRAVGFVLDGVDVSYYTNDDTVAGHTVAVFMKLKFE